MPRNKINYAAQAMFVGPSPATGSHYADGQNCYGSGTLVKELYRIQGYSYDFNFDKTPINQFGDLASLDYESATWPQVSLNFSYILSNFINEKNLGLTISTGSQINILSGILSNNTDEKNYFIAINGQDNSAFHEDPDSSFDHPGYILGFGNGFVNNYSFNVGVGQLPTVEVGVEALNLRVYDKETSLYNYLINGGIGNGGFDTVNSGDRLSNNVFDRWTIQNNTDSFIKITNDPINISQSPNPDLFLISNSSRNAYFTAATTGATDWISNGTDAASGYVFINTGTDQLVLRKRGVTSNHYFTLTSNNLNPSLSTGKWYKVIYNLASFPSSQVSDIRFGGSNILFNNLSTGLNTGYCYSSGIVPNSILIAANNTLTGDWVFNSIEIYEPKNYSARFYATGSSSISIDTVNNLYKDSSTNTYQYLNSTGLNKRYIYEFDLKYSGFESVAYGTSSKQTLYFRLGQNTNTNYAGSRFPTFDSSYSGQFNRASITASNSRTLDGDLSAMSLYNTRNFTGIDGEVWIDNAVLKQTNITDVINGNLGNGSFEIEHPSLSVSGSNINAFSGITIFQNSVYTPYITVTGSSDIPDYDKLLTFTTKSLKGTFTNVTGAGARSLMIRFNESIPKNKRFTIDYYIKASGNANVQLTDRIVRDGSTGTISGPNLITSDNTWTQRSISNVATGDTNYFQLFFNVSSPSVGDQFWVDDVNVYYYDDCYPLPTVESVSGGFNLPGNSSTNFSGQSTNSSLTSLSTLRPSDFYLNINYTDFGPSIANWKLQSCNLNLPIPRENIYDLEQRHPNKKFQYPLQGTLSLNAVLGDLVTGNLINYYLECNKQYNLNFGFMPPCSDNTGIDFTIRAAKLTNFEFTNTIGDSKTATMEFVFPIGGPTETGVGLFISGINY